MFRDREDAGRRLAAVVAPRVEGDDPVVVGLPRGGVPVAYQVARALGASLDVIVVRKLGVPNQPELAMGAIGEGGVRVENQDVVRALGRRDFDMVERHERAELDRRATQYRGGRARIDLSERCVVVIDDGIATGSTARAACVVARAQGARHVVMAAPVVSRLAIRSLGDVCDEMLYVGAPDPFYAVGEWYRDFSQTSDDEVVELLGRATEQHDAAGRQ